MKFFNLSGSYSPKLASFLAVLDTPQLAAGRFITDAPEAMLTGRLSIPKRVNGGSAAGLLPRLLFQRLDHVRLLPGIVVHKEGPRDTAVDVAVEKVEAPDHPGGGQVEELLDDSL